MAIDVYARPRQVTDLADCSFYHTFDLPHYGLVRGNTDLRGRERSYLGALELAGKRVLEVGTASGYLAFWMERQGAEVVAFDLCEDYAWDVVPYAGFRRDDELSQWWSGIRKLNNSWWLCWRELQSEAKVVYGSVYAIPAEIGPVDVTTFCSTLVHFENPFRALQNALRLTRDTVVVTEVIWNRFLPAFILGKLIAPSAAFVPNHRGDQSWDAWWFLPPALIQRFLGVLGFGACDVHYFIHRGHGGPRLAYSVVGRRTVDFIDP